MILRLQEFVHRSLYGHVISLWSRDLIDGFSWMVTSLC